MPLLPHNDFARSSPASTLGPGGNSVVCSSFVSLPIWIQHLHSSIAQKAQHCDVLIPYPPFTSQFPSTLELIPSRYFRHSFDSAPIRDCNGQLPIGRNFLICRFVLGTLGPCTALIARIWGESQNFPREKTSTPCVPYQLPYHLSRTHHSHR